MQIEAVDNRHLQLVANGEASFDVLDGRARVSRVTELSRYL